MAAVHTTSPPPAPDRIRTRASRDRLQAFLQLARTATERARRQAVDPHLQATLDQAQVHLSSASRQLRAR